MADAIAAGAAVSFGGFRAQREAIEAAISDAPSDTVALDMAGDYEVSSLLVALMLAWIRHARRVGKRVEFVNLPQSLLDVIAFSGLLQTMRIGPEAASPDVWVSGEFDVVRNDHAGRN